MRNAPVRTDPGSRYAQSEGVLNRVLGVCVVVAYLAMGCQEAQQRDYQVQLPPTARQRSCGACL